MDNLILKAIAVIAITSFSSDTASASVCEPTSQLYNVVGVESWDTLNVRSGPSTKYEVIDELKSNETGIWVTGEFTAKTDACEAACNSNVSEINDLLKKCFANGNIWYEVHVSQSEVGWASAKHLEAGTGTEVDNQLNQSPAEPSSNSGTAKLPPCIDPNWWTDCEGEKLGVDILGSYQTGISSIKGTWKDNNLHGQGSTSWSDGSSYMGEFKKGRVSGHGVYTNSEGNYVGEFQDGLFDGNGTLTYLDGEKYVGGFKGGYKSGKGVTYFADGRRYEGEYFNDLFEGFGILTFSSGNKYEGEFSNGQPNGKGTEFSVDGSVLQKGKWIDGLLRDPENAQESISVASTITVEQSQEFDLGMAAAQAGDFETALIKWMPLAEQGIPSAQYYVGVMFQRGDGVAQDHIGAIEWFRRSAMQGFGEAQHILIKIYSDGIIVAQDDIEALKWTRLAAEQGFADAQNNLGFMYEVSSYGVGPDYSSALSWYRKAALQGFAPAQISLARMFQMGNGISQDTQTAYVLYHIAHLISIYEIKEFIPNELWADALDNGLKVNIPKLVQASRTDGNVANHWNIDNEAIILRDQVSKNLNFDGILNAKAMAVTCLDSGYKVCSW
jgi:hypothetical protein